MGCARGRMAAAAGKRSLDGIAVHVTMSESLGRSSSVLNLLELRVLRLLKSRPLKEKQIAKALRLDPMVLDPVITGLILNGYLEILRRRRFYFFTRELCAITIDGIAALDRYGNFFQTLLNCLTNGTEAAVAGLISGSPVLGMLAATTRALFRVAKAIV